MAKDVWGLATEIRKEAERLESTMCDVNGDTDGMKDEIQSHIEEIESYIQEIKEQMEIY